MNEKLAKAELKVREAYQKYVKASQECARVKNKLVEEFLKLFINDIEKLPIIDIVEDVITYQLNDKLNQVLRGTFGNLCFDIEDYVKSLDISISVCGEQIRVYYHNKGDALVSFGRFAEADECFRKALEFNPEDVVFRTSHAKMLARDGKFREADEIMDAICKEEPRGPEPWFTRAEFLSAAGKHEAALKYYYVVRELSPGHSVSHFNCGNILSKLGRYEEAVECYNKALKYEKTMTGAMNNKGLALSCLGDHKEAYDCFRRVLIAQPNNPDALFNKGYELSKLERYDEAVQAFDACLSVAKDRDLIERAREEKASAMQNSTK